MCISAHNLITLFTLLIPFAYHFSCTCWVPTISVLNLTIFPCFTNLLLRRWRWLWRIMWWVLGYALLRLLFLWRYVVFCCSTAQENCLVFRDNSYVVNVLYSRHLAICEHFISVCVEQMILGTHGMSTWFCLQNRVWQHQAKQHPQDEDPILHPMHGRVGFNKNHCPPCVDRGTKSLPSSYFINIYVEIWPDITLAWSSAATSHHGQVDSVAPAPAWLDTDITSWPCHLGSTIASMTRHRYCTATKSPR
jgi:hypothetical protein